MAELNLNHNLETLLPFDELVSNSLHLLQINRSASKWSSIWGLTNTAMIFVGYFIYHEEPRYWADSYSTDVSPIHEWLLTSYATMGFGILNSLAYDWQLVMGSPSQIFTRVF